MPQAARSLTMEQLLDLPPTFGLKMGALALGIGLNTMYEYAPAGKVPWDPEPVPIRRSGGQYKMTRPDVFRALGLPPDMVRAPTAGAA